MAGFILITLFFSYHTYQRIKIWHDDISLYSDAIEKFNVNPLRFEGKTTRHDKLNSTDKYTLIGNIYYNRARSFFKLNNTENAIADFSSSIQYIPTHFEAYNNRGNCYGSLGKFELSVQDYSKAIELDPTYAQA